MNIVIYTKSGCPNCDQAKQLLKSKGMDYEERNAEDVMVFMKLMEQYPEVRQMPQIFFKGERIGGFAGLREWIKWKEQQ